MRNSPRRFPLPGNRISRLAAALAAALVCTVAAAAAQAASVYVTNQATAPGQIYPLAVAADGTISLRTPAYDTAAQDPPRVAITPDGRYLYVTSYSTSTLLDQFGLSPDGGLAALTPATVTTHKYTWPAVVSPDSASLYVGGGPDPGYTVEQLTIGANGAATHKTPASVTSTGANDIVMTPDGRHLYVSNFGGSGTIDQFNVAADGTLSPMTPATVTTPAFPVGMAVTPDGRSLYVGLDSGSPTSVAQFDIHADGTLAPKSPATVNLPAGADPVSMATSPDGGNLYVAADVASGGVDQFAIGANGTLTAMTPASVGTQTVGGVAVSPDGRNLYATFSSGGGGTARFAIGAGGALSTTSNTVATGGSSTGVTVSPDQGPTAALSVAPAAAGTPTVLNAGASTDPDGTVVRYDWSFGDGQVASTAGPTVTHVYTGSGTYSATVTVTDDSGTSTARVFTGHQVLRNGGPSAQAASTFAIPAAPQPPGAKTPVISHVKITPTRFRVSGAVVGISRRRTPSGAKVSFTLDVAGHVLARVQQVTSGRLKGKRCVAARNHGKRCAIYKTLRGSVDIIGVAGTNTVRFSGRINRKKLKPGRYRLVLTPYLGSSKGRPGTVTFTVVR